MKILQVASAGSAWGGIERYVAYLAQGLIERGHEVHVACPAGSPLDQQAPGIHHNVNQKNLYGPAAILPMMKISRNERFDIVHTHFRKDLLLPAIASRLTGRHRLVMSRHVPSGWSRWQTFRYSRLYERVISVSDAVRENLIVQCHFPEGRVVTAHAGCPEWEPSPMPQGDLVVGYFGRLSKEKGVGTLIEASRLLPENVAIKVYGVGPQEKLLKELAQGTRVEFCGSLSSVENAMKGVHVVVIPSLWMEAFPFSALEAMAAGRAIVASDVGGLPEQIVNGETGLLVPKSDPKALADAIASLERDRKRLESMGLSARDRQVTEFTIERFAARIEKVYLEFLMKGNY